MRREKFLSVLDGIPEIILIVVLIYILLPFSNTLSYFYGVLSCAVIFLVIHWYLQNVAHKSIYYVKTKMFLLFVFIIGLALIYVIPLPAAIVKVFSPETYSLYDSISRVKWSGSIPISINPHHATINLYSLVLYGCFFFLFVFCIKNTDYIKKMLFLVLFFCALYSLLWIIKLVYIDFSQMIARTIDFDNKGEGILLNKNMFSWFLLLSYFLACGFMAGDIDGNKKQYVITCFVIMTLCIVAISSGIVFKSFFIGICFFSILSLLVSKMKKTVKWVLGTALIVIMYYILKNIEGIWSVLPHFFQNHDISPQKSNLSTLYASYGVGGVGLYACIIGVYYYRLIKMILKRNDITVKMLAIGGLSGIVALLYGALFCVPFQSATIVFMCVFVMASIYVLLRIRMNESSKTGEEVFTDYTIKKLHKWQSYIAVSLGVLLTVLICTKVIKLTIAQHYFSKIMNRTEQVKIIKKGNDRTMISKLSPSCLEKDLQYAEKAIDYDQKNPLYHYTLGRLYDLSADISTTPSQQMIKNALEEYEKAVILSPGNTLFRNAVTIASKGIFLDNKNTTGRERENVSSKVSLIDKKTDNTDSARYIHEIILGALKYTDDYNELKVLVKNEEEGVYHLTIILFDNMKFEKNKNAFMQDMKLASKEERYQYVHALSDILVQKGAFADAVNLMEEYAENNPHNIEAVSWIVETVPNYPRNYNFEYVKNVFKRAHNANPENIYVLHKYVHYLYIKREYASVIKVLSDIAKKRDLHNNELYEIGKSYEQLGDKKEAITFYELILKSDPGNYEVKERVRKLSGSQK